LRGLIQRDLVSEYAEKELLDRKVDLLNLAECVQAKLKDAKLKWRQIIFTYGELPFFLQLLDEYWCFFYLSLS